MTYYRAIWAYNKVFILFAGILSSWQNNVNIILMSENSSNKDKKSKERPKLGNIKIGLNTLQKAEYETLLKIFLLKMQECFL